MEREYDQLFREMLGDIEHCMKHDLPEVAKAENAYHVTFRYCQKLMKELEKKEIESEEKEIAFFRNVKPHFTCYMQYFAMLSEALQFIPADKKLEIKFWHEECYRYIRFCKRNAVFINYYKSEDRHLDRIYFLRANNKWHDIVPASPFDMDKKYATYYEGVARGYLANRMYWEYCYKKMEMFKSDDRKV